MRLESSDLWIIGPYYIDFDPLGQLRIVGPGNHLFLGLAGIYKDDLEIRKVSLERGRLLVDLAVKSGDFFLPDPVVRHIRRVRRVTETAYEPRKNFKEIINQYPDLEPNYIYAEELADSKKIFYRRRYSHHWYGTSFVFDKDTSIKRDDKRRGFLVRREGQAEVTVTLVAESDQLYRRKVKKVLKAPFIDLGIFDDRQDLISDILNRTQAEIEHLITYDKTSGFEYGTIFPRDWMEAADLGEGDFNQETIDYMYKQALKFVTKRGVGWHEDIIGEFRQEALAANAQVINRRMIDIEPRYILGLRVVSPDFIEENKAKLQRIANFVLTEAREKHVITFKKKTPSQRVHKDDKYWEAGNWRDSVSAFRHMPLPVAPYDVSVVYYPVALRLVRDFKEVLGLDVPDIDDLVEKWETNQKRYAFYNEDGYVAAALALYDVKDGKKLSFERLEVNNLDEAFFFVYMEPTEEQAISFAKRILDPGYFFTPAGPILVDRKSGYTSKDYHGEVIWLKQVAFAVLGLTKTLDLARAKGWSAETVKVIREGALVTCENTISAVAVMRGIPELYYYDEAKGRAAFYDSQEGIEAQMSKIQLWSSVGIRQIIRSYYRMIKE